MSKFFKLFNYQTLFFTFCEIIMFLFILFFLSFMGFIVNIPINPIYFIISLVLTFYFTYLLNKSSFNPLEFIGSIILFLASFLISITVGGLFFSDLSFDGRMYHQPAVYLLKNGWNPVYYTMAEFIENAHLEYALSLNVWVECYTKFCEIISANFYSIFNKIEIGKALNFILSFGLFYISLFSISKFKNIKLWQNIVISFLLIFNPVCICQIATFYIDLIVYYFFIIILFLLILKETNNINNKLFNMFMIMNLTMFCNVKLGGIYYSVIILLTYWIYLLIVKNFKDIKNIAIISLFTLILLLLSGINPYFTNLKNGNHVFHPLAGKEKVDIMTHNLPEGFIGKNSFYKLFYATFAQTSNNRKQDVVLKVPFSIKKDAKFVVTDMRLAGFGYFWSGILLLTLILAFIAKNKDDDMKKEKYLTMCLLLLSVVLNPECWWARYVPQLWALPLFLILFKLNNQKIKLGSKFFIYILMLLIFINSAIVEYQNFYSKYRYGHGLDKIKKQNKIAMIYQDKNKKYIDEMLYLILDERNVSYKIVDEEYYQNNINYFVTVPYSLRKERQWRLLDNE